MKIVDCTSFYSEHMMYEVRLNILKDKVDKFIVTESTYSHSGKKKKLNFNPNYMSDLVISTSKVIYPTTEILALLVNPAFKLVYLPI